MVLSLYFASLCLVLLSTTPDEFVGFRVLLFVLVIVLEIIAECRYTKLKNRVKELENKVDEQSDWWNNQVRINDKTSEVFKSILNEIRSK